VKIDKEDRINYKGKVLIKGHVYII
jgi:hypothetical protein